MQRTNDQEEKSFHCGKKELIVRYDSAGKKLGAPIIF